MEKSKYGVPEASVNSEIINDNEKLRILDVDYLETFIQEVYGEIIGWAADPTRGGQFATFQLKDEKSNQKATECRKAAELLRKRGKFEEALLLITRSIAFAKRDCAELASAYCDRSYVLLKLKRYSSCIEDVDRATKIAACPRELRKMLYERKEQCLIEQEKIKAPEGGLPLEWRESCNLSPSNAHPPNLSHKLKVHSDEKREKQLIAIEDIQPGEILSVEDLYVTGLNYTEHVGSHCSFCLLKCDTLIPCFTCTREMYCSKNCRNKAFSLFHQAECKFMSMYSYGRGTRSTETAFVVKTFLIGTKQGKELDNLMKKLKPRDIFVGKCDQCTRFDDYCSILQMRKIDRFRIIDVYIAVGMVIVLIRSSFFGEFNTLPDRLSPVQSYAALLLINHIRTIEMIYPLVEKIHFWPDPLDSKSTERTSKAKYFERQHVGFAICSLQNSLMKCSCSANTSTFYQNRQRIAFATRTIQSGEKLSMALFDKSEVCESDACLTNCPRNLETLKNEEIPFSSTLDSSFETKIKALMMKTHIAIEKAKKQFPVLSNKEMLSCIIEHCNLLCKMLTIPSYDITECEQFLMALMKVLYCDYQRPYRDLSMEYFFAAFTDLISKRIYLLYDTKFAPKNRN